MLLHAILPRLERIGIEGKKAIYGAYRYSHHEDGYIHEIRGQKRDETKRDATKLLAAWRRQLFSLFRYTGAL